jgi:hypothetical protein
MKRGRSRMETDPAIPSSRFWRSHRSAVLLLVGTLVLVIPAAASYAGDHPLSTAFTGPVEGGDFIFTTGNSTYTGELRAGDSCVVTFPVAIPEGAEVMYSRLYVYWAWSRKDRLPVYPSFRSSANGETLEFKDRFMDSKGVVSSTDFFSGMDTFLLPDPVLTRNPLVITVEQTGQEGSSVVIQGVGLLVLSGKAGGHETLFWVKEGTDLLYSSYGISPEMATSRVDLDGTVPLERVEEARLLVIAPSGGYSRNNQPDMNRLQVNLIPSEQIPPLFEMIFRVIFPRFQGREWSDVFQADELHQVGLENREITPYLRSAQNRIAVQDRGDYLQLTNVVLAIRLKGAGI